jgi:hypothetical protein
MTSAPCEVTSGFHCSYGNSGASTFQADIDGNIEDIEGGNDY